MERGKEKIIKRKDEKFSFIKTMRTIKMKRSFMIYKDANFETIPFSFFLSFFLSRISIYIYKYSILLSSSSELD